MPCSLPANERLRLNSLMNRYGLRVSPQTAKAGELEGKTIKDLTNNIYEYMVVIPKTAQRLPDPWQNVQTIADKTLYLTADTRSQTSATRGQGQL